jgi:hypothetical protein
LSITFVIERLLRVVAVPFDNGLVASSFLDLRNRLVVFFDFMVRLLSGVPSRCHVTDVAPAMSTTQKRVADDLSIALGMEISCTLTFPVAPFDKGLVASSFLDLCNRLVAFFDFMVYLLSELSSRRQVTVAATDYNFSSSD